MLRDVIVRLAVSGVGVVVGVLGFFVLFVGYGNPDAGFWSVLASALASVCFHLHWVKGKDSLEVWHTPVTLRNITHVGFVSGVAGTTALIWYLFLTFYHNIPSPPIAENTLISAVWAFICGKWGFTLMFYSHNYEITIRDQIRVSSILGQDSV